MAVDLKQIHSIITFKMAGELHGLPIKAIRILEGGLPVTPIQGASKEVLGLSNLRGQIITVIDLNLIFNIDDHEDHKYNLIVLKPTSLLLNENIFEFTDEVIENHEMLAIRVAEIEKIHDVDDSDWAVPPTHLEKVKRDTLLGVVRVDGELVSVFDPGKILQMSQVDNQNG